MGSKILIWPDSKLLTPCEKVTDFGPKLTQLVINLHNIVEDINKDPNLPDALGLSAPQIGVLKRLFVYKLDNQTTCMINPVILEKEGEQIDSEGCLSFPGIFVTVKRAEKILVEFQDVNGNVNRLKTEGFTARCIQHEIDHLDGQLFINALSGTKRDILKRKMKKLKKKVKPAK